MTAITDCELRAENAEPPQPQPGPPFATRNYLLFMPLIADLIFSLTLLPHYLYHRFVTGKYGPAAREKLGHLPLRTGNGACLWVHGVSVGEVLAARVLVNEFQKQHPDWDLRISTTTATGREVADRNFGPERVFYYPLDLSWMVRRSFCRIRPSLVLLMELEVWPNFLAIARTGKVPVVVCNARITDRSVKRFRLLGKSARSMLAPVSLWLAQSDEYADRLRTIGVLPERIRVVGSLKYDSVPTEPDPAMRNEYRGMLGAGEKTRVIIGGSTHPSEEDALLSAFAALRQSVSDDLKLVLVPRHPERLDEVERLVQGVAPVRRRSTLSPDKPADTPVVLVDTMGELGRLYAAADVVFVGGSLIPHGGQNMMEPCGLGIPTVIGPSCHNFIETVALLTKAEGLIQVRDANELEPEIRNLLNTPDQALAMGKRARQVIAECKGATKRSLDLIANLMP